jgi:hypothetical protein
MWQEMLESVDQVHQLPSTVIFTATQQHSHSDLILSFTPPHPYHAHIITLHDTVLHRITHQIHNHRIVHGDLKPANFVFVKGHLKLIDFGIAKSFSNDTTNIYRESQIGTINYMAPEAICPFTDEPTEDEEGRAMKMRIGRASDIWSLGCILYQMHYGRPPFASLSTIQKLQAIPNPKWEIPYPDLPQPDEEAVAAIRSCLEREPSKRAVIRGEGGKDLLSHPFLCHPGALMAQTAMAVAAAKEAMQEAKAATTALEVGTDTGTGTGTGTGTSARPAQSPSPRDGHVPPADAAVLARQAVTLVRNNLENDPEAVVNLVTALLAGKAGGGGGGGIPGGGGGRRDASKRTPRSSSGGNRSGDSGRSAVSKGTSVLAAPQIFADADVRSFTSTSTAAGDRDRDGDGDERGRREEPPAHRTFVAARSRSKRKPLQALVLPTNGTPGATPDGSVILDDSSVHGTHGSMCKSSRKSQRKTLETDRRESRSFDDEIPLFLDLSGDGTSGWLNRSHVETRRGRARDK